MKLPPIPKGYRWDEPKPGKWVTPKKKGYRLQCCDCGLVHIFEFAHIKNPYGPGRKIILRAWRDEETTKRVRRNRRIRVKTK